MPTVTSTARRIGTTCGSTTLAPSDVIVGDKVWLGSTPNQRLPTLGEIWVTYCSYVLSICSVGLQTMRAGPSVR